VDYRNGVHLPKTDFPMRAALSEREPAQVKAWEDEKVYDKLLEKNASAPKFVFHDGPPYANGPIHQGHFLNKILKDLVCKYHLMAHHLTDFVPGWDCHGLPIERQVDKQLGPKKREMSVGEFRRACRKYAEEQIDLQRKDFKRLGIFARWDHPYKTMDFRYEADIVRELSKFAAAGRSTAASGRCTGASTTSPRSPKRRSNTRTRPAPPSTSAFRSPREGRKDGASPSGPRRPGPSRRTWPSPPIRTWSTSRTICRGTASRSSPRTCSTPS